MEADTARTPAGGWGVAVELLKGRYGPIILVAGLMWGAWQYMIVPLNKEARIDWQQQQAIMAQQQVMLNQQQAMLIVQGATATTMGTTAATLERAAEKLEGATRRLGPGAFDGGGP